MGVCFLGAFLPFVFKDLQGLKILVPVDGNKVETKRPLLGQRCFHRGPRYKSYASYMGAIGEVAPKLVDIGSKGYLGTDLGLEAATTLPSQFVNSATPGDK